MRTRTDLRDDLERIEHGGAGFLLFEPEEAAVLRAALDLTDAAPAAAGVVQAFDEWLAASTALMLTGSDKRRRRDAWHRLVHRIETLREADTGAPRSS